MKTILIIEDYEAEAFLLASLIERVGRQVEIAHTMADAWRRLRSRFRYDVVFFDLTLTDALPVHAIEALKEMSSLAKIVIVTGNDDETLKQRALEAGAHDYILKHDPNYAERVVNVVKFHD